jgi:hypothetical protein
VALAEVVVELDAASLNVLVALAEVVMELDAASLNVLGALALGPLPQLAWPMSSCCICVSSCRGHDVRGLDKLEVQESS